MKAIVGLGNPGEKFKKTRHNLGFMVLERFSKKNKFPKFQMKEEFLAMVSEKKMGKEKIILVKPQTFMNNSGLAVEKILKKLQTSNIEHRTSNLWVVHDDLDIPFGKIKISFGKSSGGHKGVQSIIDEIGTKDFVRFRIGIKPNSKFKMQNTKLKFKIRNFVLEKFNKGEEKILKEVIKNTIEAIEIAIAEGIEKAMSEFNK
jgi:PTH1 family peptidyl-tRNA hydrolase